VHGSAQRAGMWIYGSRLPCGIMFYYIYILQSEKDSNFYTGYTKDLKKRLNEHNDGLIHSTKFRRPFKLVYFEGCLNQKDATRREKYLKSTYGKRYIKSRISDFLANIPQG
jgi:putative endonuclease